MSTAVQPKQPASPILVHDVVKFVNPTLYLKGSSKHYRVLKVLSESAIELEGHDGWVSANDIRVTWRLGDAATDGPPRPQLPNYEPSLAFLRTIHGKETNWVVTELDPDGKRNSVTSTFRDGYVPMGRDPGPLRVGEYARSTRYDGVNGLIARIDGAFAVLRGRRGLFPLYELEYWDPDPVIKWLQDQQYAGFNCYFSAALPKYSASSKLANTALARTHYFHVEVDLPRDGSVNWNDPKAIEAEIEKVIAFLGEFAKRYGLHAYVVNFTGGGLQVLFKWNVPLQFSETDRATLEFARTVNSVVRVALERIIGRKLDNVADPSRILRLPGTTNYPNATKKADGRVPALAYVLRQAKPGDPGYDGYGHDDAGIAKLIADFKDAIAPEWARVAKDRAAGGTDPNLKITKYSRHEHDKLVDQLRFIPAGKSEEGLWAKVAAAIAYNVEVCDWDYDIALEILDTWSKTAEDGSYNEINNRTRFDSFRGDGSGGGPLITPGTIYYEAEKRGWNPEKWRRSDPLGGAVFDDVVTEYHREPVEKVPLTDIEKLRYARLTRASEESHEDALMDATEENWESELHNRGYARGRLLGTCSIEREEVIERFKGASEGWDFDFDEERFERILADALEKGKGGRLPKLKPMPTPAEEKALIEEGQALLQGAIDEISALVGGINEGMELLRAWLEELTPFHAFDFLGDSDLHGGLMMAMDAFIKANKLEDSGIWCIGGAATGPWTKSLRPAREWAESTIVEACEKAERYQVDPPALAPEETPPGGGGEPDPDVDVNQNGNPDYFASGEYQRAGQQGQTGHSSSSDGWTEFAPLIFTIPKLPYPMDALPERLRQVCEEMNYSNQTPVEMAPMSALAVVSLVAQGYVNVARDETLTGPVSLYFMTEADSGERKSQNERVLLEAIKEIEAEYALREKKRQEKVVEEAIAEPEVAPAAGLWPAGDDNSDLVKWVDQVVAETSKDQSLSYPTRDDVCETIARLEDHPSRDAVIACDSLYKRLKEIVNITPIREKVRIVKSKTRQIEKERKKAIAQARKDVEVEMERYPIFLRGSGSIEGLTKSLANEYPSGAQIEAEAGSIFGGYAHGPKQILQTLGVLNKIWDGASHRSDFATKDTVKVENVRLTCCYQIQSNVLKSLYEVSGDLMRGSGWMSRFLVARVESTAGYRPYKKPIPGQPAARAFEARIRAILRHEPHLNELGGLKFETLQFSEEAYEAWQGLYNETEISQRADNPNADIKDIASKAADNIARLAAIFHVFDFDIHPDATYDPQGRPIYASAKISADHVKAAGRLVMWHLNEARRFFAETTPSAETKDAVAVFNWIVRHCRKNHVKAIGWLRLLKNVRPDALRNKKTLLAALEMLRDFGYVVLDSSLTAYVRPELLD